jgi:hypothetical protein
VTIEPILVPPTPVSPPSDPEPPDQAPPQPAPLPNPPEPPGTLPPDPEMRTDVPLQVKTLINARMRNRRIE